MQQSLVQRLLAQREALVIRNPGLTRHFVDLEMNGQKTPFLPIGNFRHFHVFQHEAAHKTFLSSGSTNDRRGQHSFTEQGLLNYQRATAQNFRAFLASLNVDLKAPIVSLVPTPAEWPQSSLAAMIDMFRFEGLHVTYDLGHRSECKDLVVFGTSIHHVLKERPQDVAGKNVVVIDTGGTKGRTRNYSLEEVHQIVSETYAGAASCRIVSEYGMCELTSQAWSLHAPHDGWFRTNTGLTPVIVDLDARCVVREDGKVGFLGFIDEGNQDSFMAIITEDLAFVQSDRPGCFKLVGRAPDASQKGCSLNVKANFVETEQESLPADLAPASFRVCERGKNPWDKYAQQDLELALKSIQGSPGVSRSREGQKILMVLSANIPITFLYPTVMCFHRGVKEVHLQLPSLRVNDPTSEVIRKQIATLVEGIRPLVWPMEVHMHQSRGIALSGLGDFDAVVVFGSDETLQTFAEHIPGKTQLIGLGSIQNAMRVGKKSASELAVDCSRWLGRGCLTPVALVGDVACEEFAAAFEKNFSARLKAAGLENPYAHRHRLLEIEAIPGARIFKGANTFVADMRDAARASCVGGGSGLVYIISDKQLAELGLQTYETNPDFLDPHQGKTWAEWI